MNKDVTLFGFNLTVWIVTPVFLGVWIAGGWFIKQIVFAWFRRVASRTKTTADDILLEALNIPIAVLILTSGGAAVFHFVLPDAPAKWTTLVSSLSKVLTVLALVYFVDRLLLSAIRAYALKIEILKLSQAFAGAMVHVVVIGIGMLILLDSLGISITPVIASLGIGSLAVALALQPTLENLFSGFQILIDQPIRPGHFIKLETGEEGYVEKVGWRSTWVRQLGNNMVVLPNKLLVNSRVTNYYYPSVDQAVLINVGVHYASDLAKVEQVTTEVAAHIMKTVKGGVPDFQPFIRFHTFNSSSIDFTVILRAQEFVDNYLIKHEFVKALASRYAKEGIVIPFPITALNTSQESSVLGLSRHPTTDSSR